MKIKNKNKNNKGEIIIYKTKDGRMTVDVQLQEETIWLNAHQMAKLFDVDRTGIVRHIRNAYKSQELKKNSTCAKIAPVQIEGLRQIKKNSINSRSFWTKRDRTYQLIFVSTHQPINLFSNEARKQGS